MERLASKQTSDFNFCQDEFICIIGIINDYFEGLYLGDIKKLKRIFHPDAVLKAPNARRTREEWLKAVEERPIPAEQGALYDFKLLSIEVEQDQAMVKVSCPLFEYQYIDYLGLLKENNQWLIVNKMYTDIKSSN